MDGQNNALAADEALTMEMPVTPEGAEHVEDEQQAAAAVKKVVDEIEAAVLDAARQEEAMNREGAPNMEKVNAA